MGAYGAIVYGFFGAVLLALTLRWPMQVDGAAPLLAFAGFALLLCAAILVLRMPGQGVRPSPRVRRVILLSSLAEGLAIPVALNVAIRVHRPDWMLPAMVLVVGLHFVPIAVAARFAPIAALALGFLLAALVGFLPPQPLGGAVCGLAAAPCLWLSAILALVRDRRARLARI